MNMENSKKTEIVKSILSKTDFLEMENQCYFIKTKPSNLRQTT